MYLRKEINSIEAVPQKSGKGVFMKMLLSPDESPNFAMRNFTIEAGGHMPLHTNSVEHEQYVLSGRALVQIGDETFEAKAGDILLIPAGLSHSYKTLGSEAYSFLCLVPNSEDSVVLIK
ncbi:cupin domain-containing protein [Sulfurimonas sp.]|uniref:cupin domain-containing protein n=1 Tax=Sulfurimonas sp. TaxID=2022749 RepID=UPI0025EF90A7|nr:cupin domain-containing protein [Sulfurimonas sp.]MBW6487787.1 cupin domain-containing protein [Sulfurimonas sp.]